MNTNIQMNEEWTRQLQSIGISGLQLERALHICKGSPMPLRLCDVLFAVKCNADIDNRSNNYINNRKKQTNEFNRQRQQRVIVEYK
jgi:hypothetical protein